MLSLSYQFKIELPISPGLDSLFYRTPSFGVNTPFFLTLQDERDLLLAKDRDLKIHFSGALSQPPRGTAHQGSSPDSVRLFKTSTASASGVLANCLFATEEKTWFTEPDARRGGQTK